MTPREPVLLITGASGGIRSATARPALVTGWRQVLLARSPRITQLAQEQGDESVAQPMAGDVTERADLQHAVGVATEKFGGLDAAFANAGITAGRVATDQTPTKSPWASGATRC